MAEEMQTFVERMKESVGRGQEDTMKEINTAVSQLGEQLGDVMKTMESSRESLAAGAAQAQQQVQDGARTLVSDLGENVQALLTGLQEQQQGSALALRQIDEVTRQSIAGMKDGADRMRGAADRFGAAGESALKLMDASGNAAQQFNASGATVASASRELGNQVAAYQKQQEGLQRLLSTVEGITAGSQNEANSRAKMITELTQVVARMKEVNTEAVTYLDRVGNVLDGSFSRFGDGIEQNLTRTLGCLDQELSKAVGALSSGVQEIGDSVEELSDALGKLKPRS
jgi:phage-related protein